MLHISFGDTYDTAILIKSASLRSDPIERNYFDNGLVKSRCIAFSLDYAGKKKPSKGDQRAYLEELLPALDKLGIKNLFVCDGEYFKTLANKTKADPYFGYVEPCVVKGFEHMTVTLGLNYGALFHKPESIHKLKLSIDALNDYTEGTYSILGEDVLTSEDYPTTLGGIRAALQKLLLEPALTCDIEAFSLKHHDSGIGTIAFSPDDNSGVAFPVDYVPLEVPEKRPTWCTKDKKDKMKVHYGEQVHNAAVRALLKEFFENYKGSLIYHNFTYDGYILVYQLWMSELLDTVGLLEGLDIICRGMEDTKLITYLAVNSCAGNKLSLKEQAHEYLGNYAQSDINDIRLIPLAPLLKYNLLDCAGTWFVMDKHLPTVVIDEQYDLYQDKFKAFCKDIIHMQLTGLCLDMKQVLIAEKQMVKEREVCLATLASKPIMKQFVLDRRLAEVEEYNTTRVNKRITLEDTKYKFNPNSPVQVQELLYEYMDMPVIDRTKTKQPAVGGKTIEKLIKMTRLDNEDYIAILQALYDYSKVDKILSSFIPAFKRAPLASDGMHYLYGSFNLNY